MKKLAALIVLVTAVGVVGIATDSASALSTTSAVKYSNCTKLNQHYPHGVGRKGAHDHVTGKSKPVTNFKVSTTTYNANTKSDRDHDGIACEKH